ncbi:MAG TPA: zinc ribbon domain-containing protein [Kofleriaceae bacterium]
MTAIAFTRNYTDHSSDTGFQFEFHCDKCGNGYRSSFHANALGVGAKLAKGLGSLFGGGSLWAAGQAGEYMKDGLRGPAWDNAFKAAIEEIKPKFHQCTRCGIWTCPEVCWNAERGMCENCAPNLAEEAASAQAHIAADQAKDKMRAVDQVKDFDPLAQHSIGAQCAGCHASLAPGAKFCASCGKPASAAQQAGAKAFCTGCGTQLPPGGRFCASCGTAAG